MPNPIVLFENPKVRIEMEPTGNTVVVRPIGVLDEDVNFSVVLNLVAELGATLKVMQFDMGHVARMNSCGVREWLLLMERLSPSVSLAFENANELFIEQANIIPKMFGKKGAALISFHAPYHCSKCDEERSALLKPSEVKYEGSAPVPPVKSCDQCKSEMEFDWLPEEYFGFIKRL